jgi:hypothetical protein
VAGNPFADRRFFVARRICVSELSMWMDDGLLLHLRCFIFVALDAFDVRAADDRQRSLEMMPPRLCHCSSIRARLVARGTLMRV